MNLSKLTILFIFFISTCLPPKAHALVPMVPMLMKKAKSRYCSYQIQYNAYGNAYTLKDSRISVKAYTADGRKTLVKKLKNRASDRAISCIDEKVSKRNPAKCNGIVNHSKEIDSKITTIFSLSIKDRVRKEICKNFKQDQHSGIRVSSINYKNSGGCKAGKELLKGWSFECGKSKKKKNQPPAASKKKSTMKAVQKLKVKNSQNRR